MTEKLMPCPFCGGTAELCREGGALSDWFASCETCSATTSNQATLQEAALVWNARPLESQGTPTPAADEVEAVAWAIIRAANEEDAVRELQEYGNAGPFARAAIAALQARSAEHPDDIAVDRFAAAMKAKLAQKRREGRGGWQNRDECSAERLSSMLRDHVGKGDPVDVANFAMMLHQRGDRITSAEPAGEEPVARYSNPEVGALATVLFEAFKRAEPEEGISKFPASYMATFADMAHAAICARPSLRPATPTNPERLVEARAQAFEEAAKVAETLRIGGGTLSSWIRTNESPMGATQRHIAEAIRALTAAPLKEGEGGMSDSASLTPAQRKAVISGKFDCRWATIEALRAKGLIAIRTCFPDGNGIVFTKLGEAVRADLLKEPRP